MSTTTSFATAGLNVHVQGRAMGRAEGDIRLQEERTATSRGL